MNEEPLKSYYGDTVRAIFVMAGIVIIASYPFFSSFIKTPIPFAIMGCVVLSIFGGLLNPREKWVMFFSAVLSFVAFSVFEYAATYTYLNLPPTENVYIAFFWINQVLSLIFFFSLYLSTKTFRTLLSSEKKHKHN